MIEKLKSYFTKLERLSDDELDRSAQTLVKSENESARHRARQKGPEKETRAVEEEAGESL